MLGSSPHGSNLAAGLEIGYTFAGFINPLGASPALRHYRETLRPQGFGLESPRAILAVNVTVGDSQADGERRSARPRASTPGWAGWAAGPPSPRPTRPSARSPPDQVRATLEQMGEESGADEVMVQNLIADPADRMRSHELSA